MNALNSRRQWLWQAGGGLGAVALAELLRADAAAAPRGAGRRPHFTPRAKSVIYIHLVGAPSHLDLFDFKPELQQRSGQLCPDEFFVGKQLAFIRSQPKLLGTPDDPQFRFRRCGESGIELSDLLPKLQQVVDRLCFIRTVRTEQFNHAPAQLHALTGFGRFGRPSIGSWVSYGLGTENADLPAFVVLVTGPVLGAGNSAWGSGFLPTVHQGVEFRSQGDPVLFLSNPRGIDAADRRTMIDTVNGLNRLQLQEAGDPEISTRISQYEMAYRMQTSVPELMDIREESAATHALYGTKPGQTSFANNCLLARRLVERGVRFVQLFDADWDHHGGVFQRLPGKCKEVDQPIAALITDLAQRGLLDETLVVWSAEFGRTPMAQGSDGSGAKTAAGRDHHKEAYTVWMAGGGVRGGHVHGRTDDLGYAAAQDGVDVHDVNATILHLLGLDHQRLTFPYQGRDFRLTDVHGRVIEPILA